MKIKNKNLKALMEVNNIVISNVTLKVQLEKPLLSILSAQKNFKTLREFLIAFENDKETIKKESSLKDEKGEAIVLDTPQGKAYDIPEEKKAEAMAAMAEVAEQDVEVSLSVFSENSCDVICKHLNGEQTEVLIEFLLERKDE